MWVSEGTTTSSCVSNVSIQMTSIDSMYGELSSVNPFVFVEDTNVSVGNFQRVKHEMIIIAPGIGYVRGILRCRPFKDRHRGFRRHYVEAEPRRSRIGTMAS